MPRYIDIEPFEQLIYEEGADVRIWIDTENYTLSKKTGTIPTADVEKVAHAFWEPTDAPGIHKCSNCAFPDTQPEFRKRCSNCGAKMDGWGAGE